MAMGWKKRKKKGFTKALRFYVIVGSRWKRDRIRTGSSNVGGFMVAPRWGVRCQCEGCLSSAARDIPTTRWVLKKKKKRERASDGVYAHIRSTRTAEVMKKRCGGRDTLEAQCQVGLMMTFAQPPT